MSEILLYFYLEYAKFFERITIVVVICRDFERISVYIYRERENLGMDTYWLS